MGTPFAVTAANAFMYYHERDIIENFSRYLPLYKRFIDDIFVIWDGPREILLEFLYAINTKDERIKITYEISESKISFLDLFLFKVDGCATLHYSTFQKPLNKYLYIPYESFHPKGDQKDLLEGKLTLEECRRPLMCLWCGKSPGEDSFSVEFYQFFFELLGQEFLNSINASYDKNELSISQRGGVISLIPKEDANLKDLANWEPITLLNVDYKIASKAIATRIEKVLPLIINSNQTGFIKGCYIRENICLITDILEQTKAQEIPGILLLLDFRKAFDTVEWGFIQNTLDLFNFEVILSNGRRHFIITLRALFFIMDLQQIILNYQGVRQGSPLSPYLFILGAEILAARVRLERNIEGITLFNIEHKVSQFADDTSLLLKNVDSITNAIGLLRLFGNISALKLNLGKTKAIWLGSWRHKVGFRTNLNE